ncbi:MAG: Putative PQQ enzyme repeat [Candidatus Kapaibacterium sp.]|nr:MAG: Putative PQQ enzyme repeat [Candidatus Kapabacteria bacterium]
MKNKFSLLFFLLMLFKVFELFGDNLIIQRTVWNNPSPGYLFLGPMDNSDLAVYDNSGFKVYTKNFGFLRQGFIDFKMHPNGKLSAFDVTSSSFFVLDSNFNVIDTVRAVGYNTDFHEFLILPNGNYMVIAEADTFIDMSRIVPNGHPNCKVNNFKIQEIDYRTKQVVWQWSALDHFSITDATEDIDLESNYIRPFHINSIELLSDGNLLISCRHLDEITKINRQTGEIIWRMGGSKCRNNQFTFVNDTVNNFFGFSHQHDPRELPNGNILLFDNGNLKPTRYSRVVEYQIDEANRVVRKVWEYRAPSNIVSNAMGSCQRLPNGNTLIAWGGTTAEGGHNYLLSEVTPSGRIALEFYSNVGTYRAFRHIFKMDAVTNSITSTGLSDFRNSVYNTNVSLFVSNLNGSTKYTVEKHYYIPHNLSQGGPCSTIPYRWVVTKQSSNSIAGYIYFNLNGLSGFTQPESLKVYYREGEGFGAFTQLNTSYNSQYNRLEAPFAGVGEYCIGTFAIGVPKPIYPENNAINVPISPKFIWNKFIVGEKYHLQISFYQNFQNVLFDIENISDTVYNLSNLMPGKTYYWRVRAERESCVSDWSDVQAFTTIFEKINVFAPADSSLDMPLKVQFTWANSNNAWSYQFQIAIDSKFERIVKDTVVYNPQVEISDLDYYTTYYWRVRLLRGEQYGMWSDVRWFLTTIAPPILQYPSDEAKNVPISSELSWTGVPGAIHYYLQVSKSNQFVDNVIEIVDLKQTKYQFSNLEYATTYYWRVRATGEVGKSEWSKVYKFTTLLPSPQLLRPPFADTLAPVKGILQWKPVDNATNYEVQICEKEDFSIGVISYKVVGQTFVQYSELAYSTKYNWRVRAYNSDLESQWSNIFWFKTIPENYLPPPILSYPTDNSVNLRINDKLIWYSVENAQGYLIQISTDRFFNNKVVEIQTSDTMFSIQNLAYGTRYYWRVQAINNSFNSFWSDVYSFTTALREPTLMSPAKGAVLSNLPIEFEWELTNAKAFYEIQIAYDPEFQFILKQQVLYNQNTFTLETAPPETWFNWRVRVKSGVLESDWSEVYKFKVKGVNSVDETTENYLVKPSIGNVFEINTNLPVSKVEVYNSLGEIIMQKTAPDLKTYLDLSNYPVGTYLIKIYIEKEIHFTKVINIR